MTNSEKIKAYLDAGHKVVVNNNDNDIIYGYTDDGLVTIYGELRFNFYDDYDISIHQEPLRYPKVGDKVVDLRTGEVGEVYDCLDFCCIVDDVEVDYRNLAPYIE